MTIPGQGIKGPGCGLMVKVRCNECGAVFEVEQGCGLRTCPRCWRKWARREAMAATDITLARWARYPRDRLVHAVVSFPGTPDQVFEKRPRAIKIAKRHGVYGFAIVGHHVRGDQPGDYHEDGYIHYHILGAVTLQEGFRTVPDLIVDDFLTDDPTKGYWTSTVDRPRPPQWAPRPWEADTWVSQARLCPAGVVSGTYNWTFKVIRQRGSWYVGRARVFKILKYNLEHCSIQHRRHALTWAGSWWDRDDGTANQVGGEGKPGAIECPKCGGSDTAVEAGGPEYETEQRFQERRARSEWTPGPDAPLMTRKGGGTFEVAPYFKEE